MNIALRHRQTDTSAIEIRLATLGDVPLLTELLGAFFAESQWPAFLTYDAAKSENYLRRSIELGFAHHIIALDDGELVGVISYHLDRDKTEPIAVMDETYVKHGYRHTNLGRKLVALALYVARGDGARIFNFPLASGLNETRTYVNMLRKFGGVPCGVIVRVDLGGDDGR